MKTPEEITEEVMQAVGHGPDKRGYGEAFTMRPVTAVRAILRAIEADRAQRPAIATYGERDVEVGIWPAHPDFEPPHAIVVQIDTGENTGRIRVNLNDGELPIWDGDPSLVNGDNHWLDLIERKYREMRSMESSEVMRFAFKVMEILDHIEPKGRP